MLARDHFSAIAMINYLTANPEVSLVAPQQALEMMQENANWDEALRERMTILDMEAGDTAEAITIGDITATAAKTISPNPAKRGRLGSDGQ